MRYLLSAAQRPLLSRLARERTLCAFDFDGTLAPIARHPDQARMSGRTRRLLARLAERYECVIVSGRSRADLVAKLEGVPVHQAIGNHGADPGRASRPASGRRVRRWKSALEKELSRIPGLWIEDKGLSLAVHYRDSSAKPATRRRILKAAEGLAHARVFGGKQVVNIAVDGDPNKGTALVAERETRGCDWVLYVGDDINDEDAFAIGGNLVSVRVGRTRQSYAAYYLRSQREIDTLLDRLVALRQAACLLKPGSEAGRAEREPRSAGRRFPLRRGDHAHPGNCCE